MGPTHAQISLLYRWFQWKMPMDEARQAVNWLEKHATRKQVSQEIKRVGDLYHDHRLDKETCFSADIWSGYSYQEATENEIKSRLVVDRSG